MHGTRQERATGARRQRIGGAGAVAQSPAPVGCPRSVRTGFAALRRLTPTGVLARLIPMGFPAGQAGPDPGARTGPAIGGVPVRCARPARHDAPFEPQIVGLKVLIIAQT